MAFLVSLREAFPLKEGVERPDGITHLSLCGEIKQTFYRNNWSVDFRALVEKNLHSNYVRGTPFINNNTIDQRFKTRSIDIHNKKHSIPDMRKEQIMTISSQANSLKTNEMSYLVHMETKPIKILLPGQTLEARVSTPNGDSPSGGMAQ